MVEWVVEPRGLPCGHFRAGEGAGVDAKDEVAGGDALDHTVRGACLDDDMQCHDGERKWCTNYLHVEQVRLERGRLPLDRIERAQLAIRRLRVGTEGGLELGQQGLAPRSG